MAAITVEQLRERHRKLSETREHELREHMQRDAGYRFVLGELELMIKELEQIALDEQQRDPIDELQRELEATGATPDS